MLYIYGMELTYGEQTTFGRRSLFAISLPFAPISSGLTGQRPFLYEIEPLTVCLWDAKQEEQSTASSKYRRCPKYPSPSLYISVYKNDLANQLTVPDTCIQPEMIGPILGPTKGARQKILLR